MSSELEGCVITFDQLKSNLEEIELNLSIQLKILSDVRKNLIEMDICDELPNIELVNEWRATYSSFLESERFRQSVAIFCQEIKSASIEDNISFQNIMKKSLTYINSDDLRHALDIPKPTLSYWVAGIHLPFPIIRKNIFKIIIEKLEALI